MKLGIITVHNGYNYGASMQAFSLVNVLRKFGHEAYLIDYRTKKIESKKSEKQKIEPWSSISNIKSNLNYIFLNGKGYALRRDRFDLFNNRIIYQYRKPFYSCEELSVLNDEFDGFICGSDQIWNVDITDYDESFFLGFADKEKLRMSYAPSLGCSNIYADERKAKYFKKNLSNIAYLSVREKINEADIEELASNKCSTVIDPTLLLTKEEWRQATKDTEYSGPNYKYGFYYQLYDDPQMYEFALTEARKRKIKLLRADINPIKARILGAISVSKYGIGPDEFLNLIINSEFVVTNSFHGTVFSILFEKEFFTMLLKGSKSDRSHRVLNLCDSLGLTERIIGSDNYNRISINWELVKQKLSMEREFSTNFILNSIEDFRGKNEK